MQPKPAPTELVEVLKNARYFVQLIWDETKGTEREGSAMGAADCLRRIDKAIAKAEGKEVSHV